MRSAPPARGTGAWLARLGDWCWRHAWLVVLAWIAAAVIGGIAGNRLPERMLSGSGDIEGSMSLRVDRSLQTDFAAGSSQTLMLTMRSPRLQGDPSALDPLVAEAGALLLRQPAVEAITVDRDMPDERLTPASGTGRFLIVELKTRNVLTTEEQVPVLRAAVAPLMTAATARDPGLEQAITGQAALTYDLNRFNAEDGLRTELKTLPLTLIVLILAFGSIAAAMMPLVLAVAARAVTLGLLFLLAGPVDISNLVPGIATMLAIALGIDYSLFLIHRYRDQLGGAAEGDRRAAIRAALEQSGSAVLYSGLTVAIGMGALMATPLMQTRSIGLGGLVVVLVTLAAALTLVPALLRLTGSWLLAWPAPLTRRLSGERSRRWWRRWAEAMMHRPLGVIAVSLAILLGLSAPALNSKMGFPESDFLPAQLEYSRGLAMLSDMKLRGLISPVSVVVVRPAGEAAVSEATRPALEAFRERLEQHPGVKAVLGPVPSAAERARPPASMEEAMAGALVRDAFVSEDRSKLLFQIIPADQEFADLRRFTAALPAMLDAPGLTLEAGGQAQYYTDLEASVARSMPLTIGLVLAMSAIALLAVFRAPLVAAKALLLNLLSVTAGYGVVVLVFQMGYGAELFGLSGGAGSIPITIPLMIFCILFGLSMDYEIFLLSRARTLYLESGDNEASVREALADTGAVITSAALIMVIVFGAFAFARVIIVQMLGLGLAVAVLVDATLIRSALGPALMQVAGRWNWWPHRPRTID